MIMKTLKMSARKRN
ncbi:hypothetical protein [Escherichia coli]|nr:hypothetical protein [Escherichia coli]